MWGNNNIGEIRIIDTLGGDAPVQMRDFSYTVPAIKKSICVFLRVIFNILAFLVLRSFELLTI